MLADVIEQQKRILAEEQARLNGERDEAVKMRKKLDQERDKFDCESKRARDEIQIERASEWSPPNLTAESLAFLQYTSGSTATPRGVRLT